MFVAWCIVRLYGASGFAEYLTIASLVSIFSVPSLGIQNAFAIGVATHLTDSQNPVGRKRSVNPLILGVGIVICWMSFTPLAFGALKTSVDLMIWSVPLVVSTIAISVGSGILQGSGAIIRWRVLLAATSLLQLPIVLFVTLFELTLTRFIFLLSIPGLTFALVVIVSNNFFWTVSERVRVSISGTMWPIQFAASSSLLLLLNRTLIGENRADLVVIMYLFSSISNVAISLGSASFSRLFRKNIVSWKILSIQTLVGLLPLMFGILLFIQQSRFRIPLPVLQSFRYPPVVDVVALTSSAVVWAVLGTILYSRMNLINRQLVWFSLGLLFIELLVFRFATVRGTAAIWMHASVGVCQLTATIGHILNKSLFAQPALKVT